MKLMDICSAMLTLRRLLMGCLLLVCSAGAFAATSVVKTTYIGICGGYVVDLNKLTCDVSGNSLSCTYKRYGFDNSTSQEVNCNGTGQTINALVTSTNPLDSVQFIDAEVLKPTDRVCATDSLNATLCWNINYSGAVPSMTMSMTVNNDIDSDGVQNSSDNCLTKINSNQLDTDSDLQGNACDLDDDNDGVADASDAFALDFSASIDADQDGLPNDWNAVCDTACQSASSLVIDNDDDDDTIADANDNCPNNSNANQADLDGDGAGNTCDNDSDNDGQLNAADTDDDNDGVIDTSDAYPFNPLYSADTDRDTLPDNWELSNGKNPSKADYAISTNATHTCAIDDTGVKCWGGSNGSGQLNVPTTLVHPYAVSNGNNWSCACDDNGSQCWGSGYPATPSCVVSTAGGTTTLLSNGNGFCNTQSQSQPPGFNVQSACAINSSGDVFCDASGTYKSYPLSIPQPYQCVWTTVNTITGQDKTFSPGNIRQISMSSGVSQGQGSPGRVCTLSDKGIACNTLTATVGGAPVTRVMVAEFTLPSLFIDSDGDGVPRPADPDDLDAAKTGDTDGDGYPDTADAFPANPAEWLDSDNDGIGNNADMDDDNDGVPDYIDADPLNAAINTEKLLPVNGGYKGSTIRESQTAQ